MVYYCPVCKKGCKDGLEKYISHTQSHIIDLIKKQHPEWIETDGLCPNCKEYFDQQIKGNEV